MRWDSVAVTFDARAGRIETVLRIRNPKLRIVRSREPQPREPVELPPLPAALRKAAPIDVDRVEIHGGELVIYEPSGKRVLLWLHGLEISLENIATRRWLTEGRPVLLSVAGKVQKTGALTMFLTADPFGSGLNFSGRAAVNHLETDDLYQLLRATLQLHAPEGVLDVYAAFQARQGRISGGVKPILRGPEIEPAGGGLFTRVKAFFADLVTDVAADDVRGRDAVATVIPIEGQLTSPAVQLWPAVLGILYNGFITGVQASFAGLPPATAPERHSRGEQAWRVLIEDRRPRAQPVRNQDER